jgi:uncharacterized protein (TIGR02284 family)
LENNDIVTTLNELIEVCKDGEQSYKNASDDVKDGSGDDKGVSIKEVLLQYSEQRGRLYSELQYILSKMGEEVEFGSISGVLRRRWIDVKFGAAGSDIEAIIKQCIKDEKDTLEKYKEALAKGLPEHIQNVVQRQYHEINEAYQDLLQFSSAQGFSS